MSETDEGPSINEELIKNGVNAICEAFNVLKIPKLEAFFALSIMSQNLERELNVEGMELKCIVVPPDDMAPAAEEIH